MPTLKEHVGARFMRRLSQITVMVVDDFPIVREGLRKLIDAEHDMHVVAEARNGVEAVECAARHEPDVVLMDLRLPKMNGVVATTKICKRSNGSCRIVVLTGSSGHEAIYRALEAGAKGYLLKTAPTEEILKAIRTVASGKRYLPPSVMERLGDRMAAEELTKRELEILELIIHGFTNAEIAAQLELTQGTVKGHINRLLRKLGVAHRTGAALAALSRGIFLWTDSETVEKVSARM